jgi:hypothetical protein
MRGASDEQRGFATPEALVGVLLAFAVVLAALTLARGTQELSHAVRVRAERTAALLWALDQIARAVERAGIGVCPGGEPACPDETVELFTDGALGVRGDLDRDDPQAARDPEDDLEGDFPRVATGNDEVVVFLRRAGGQAAALFDADLDSTDRVTRADGSSLARRDGEVEPVDAGPYDLPGVGGPGTLYRVTFVDDARWAGTGRFRVVEPLADDVVDLSVAAFDAAGRAVAACGGADDTAARACRASIRRLVVRASIGGAGGTVSLAREVALPALAREGP